MATGGAVGLGLSFSSTPAAGAPSFALLRSSFLAASSARRLRNYRLPRRHIPPSCCAPFRKCVAQISSLAIPTGMAAEIHESMLQLHLGVLQRVADLGFPLPANDTALSWWGIAVPVVLWYIVAVPGSVSGLLDFAYSPLHASSDISFDSKEVEVGRQIGQGSFGIVYEGYIRRGKKKGSQKDLHVILKKEKAKMKLAAEMHNTEVHMNRRVKRTAPSACADFLGTTEVISSQSRGRLSEGLWLVWRYEGDQTLAYYMKQKNFPANITELVLESESSVNWTVGEKGNAVIRKIAIHILTCLRDLHKTGVVHRDVKPQNLILAEDTGKFKLIDLGAAVDLRSGYNFVPDETIIDPVYAAPERHVMPTSTPQLPPDPFCSLVSPMVWLLNTPDRFDLFSTGLILLQMAVKPLRQDISLQAFNSEFKRAGYNLDAWRRKCRFSHEEFSLLDADDAAGWELVRSMLQPRHDQDFYIWPGLRNSRPSAEAALKHRFLTGSARNFPVFNVPEVPSFLRSFQPANLVPKFAFWAPQLPDISPIMPIVVASTLIPVVGWLVFSALRESAQKSYAVGQQAMESASVTGSVLLVSILLFRSLLQSLTTKSAIDSLDSNDVVPVETIDVERYNKVNLPVTVKMNLSQEGSTNHLHSDSLITMDQVPSLPASDVDQYSKNRKTREILSSVPSHMRLQQTETGLEVAIQTMESQLASLESAVAASRRFSQQQQRQIIQMEKLLIKQPQELVSGRRRSEN